MDPPSRSPALNPASTPFFPGAMRLSDEDGNPGLAYRQSISRDQQYSTSSSFSISPSDYRSVRSSPSPPQDDRPRRSNDAGLQVPSPGDTSRHSPALRQSESERAFAAYQNAVRDQNAQQNPEHLADGDETPGPLSGPIAMNGQLSAPSSFYNQMAVRSRERMNTPPVAQENNSVRSTTFMHPQFVSSSPVSSLDSGSHFAPSLEYNTSTGFEAQLKSSPLMNDVLDRLARLEMSNREIARDLGDVHRKVDLLVERALNANSGMQNSGMNAPIEFKDPFAPAGNPSQGFVNSGLNGPRGSIANIAPNQSPPTDDINTISSRLNTLTTSVGQLLALQTQHIQASNGAMHNAQMLPQTDLSTALPPILNASASLGHGLPGRPDIRQSQQRMPQPPMRTWSAGTLDLPMRNTDSPAGSMGRQDSIFRDKRRSVSGLLRRDSLGGESLSGGSSRDGGPVITKWEQLNLAPELLRSLSTFGVGPPNKIQQRALPFLLRGADIIAQAPPTQERIAAYVIPAIHIAVTTAANARAPLRGPLVVMISTTVDQATQAQRMIRDLGGPIGVKSALGVGSASANTDLSQEMRLLQQNIPHIICGTPQKLHALFTNPGGLSGADVRFLVLDEVDQLIARNLHESVFGIIRLLPPPRSRAIGNGASTPGATTPGAAIQNPFSNWEASSSTSSLLAPTQSLARRFSGVGLSPPAEASNGQGQAIERQTALFSNTVPQDVLNLASAIQLREPVRVLVRRDGNVTHADTSQGARGLRQFYLYLAFTASGRSDAPLPQTGLGIIGSGRGASNAETAQAREWKLDALADLFDDLDIPQAIIHVGGMAALDAVVYKLSSRGLEAVPLHGDMNAGVKLAALNKFRPAPGIGRPPATKVLVVYDVQVKAPEVQQVPLVINYDLPKAVEEYAQRVAPAIAPNYSRAGVVVNFVTATGGDVEMLRSIECFYKYV
ncbi:ATP-dependent RNA helicase FAL1 [Trametes pubescens]|uniref:RNA helicase n=1 Tax=Trametes pubescens TaxID=154538 RepID=A0A1M2VSA3_TRAPU|nr:ATP-dependent RNA helicase FAL1 [Trametes pubescens]